MGVHKLSTPAKLHGTNLRREIAGRLGISAREVGVVVAAEGLEVRVPDEMDERADEVVSAVEVHTGELDEPTKQRLDAATTLEGVLGELDALPEQANQSMRVMVRAVRALVRLRTVQPLAPDQE